MPDTLTVKNTTNKKVDLKVSNARTVPVEGGREAELDAEAMKSEAFRSKFIDGTLQFVIADKAKFTARQRELSREVLRGLLGKESARIVETHRALEAAVGALDAARKAVVARRAEAEKIVERTGAAKKGAANLGAAAALFLTADAESKKVADVTEAIAAHMKVVPDKPEVLAVWYGKHKELEAILKAAEDAEAAAVAQLERLHGASLQQLKVANDKLAGIDLATVLDEAGP